MRGRGTGDRSTGPPSPWCWISSSKTVKQEKRLTTLLEVPVNQVKENRPSAGGLILGFLDISLLADSKWQTNPSDNIDNIDSRQQTDSWHLIHCLTTFSLR